MVIKKWERVVILILSKILIEFKVKCIKVNKMGCNLRGSCNSYYIIKLKFL